MRNLQRLQKYAGTLIFKDRINYRKYSHKCKKFLTKSLLVRSQSRLHLKLVSNRNSWATQPLCRPKSPRKTQNGCSLATDASSTATSRSSSESSIISAGKPARSVFHELQPETERERERGGGAESLNLGRVTELNACWSVYQRNCGNLERRNNDASVPMY